MTESAGKRVLVIGIGNLYRHDDGAGLVVARLLIARQGLTSVASVLERDGEGTSLMEAWQGWHTVILIDAVSSGVAAGDVHYFDCSQKCLAAELFTSSSHSFGVVQAVELARALGQLPPSIVVYGIEGQDFSPGVGLTPEVQDAVAWVTATVIECLQGKENCRNASEKAFSYARSNKEANRFALH